MRILIAEDGASLGLFFKRGIEELRARCRALMRRPESNLMLRHSGLKMSRVNHTVRAQRGTIPLTNEEFALLEVLLLHRGSSISWCLILRVTAVARDLGNWLDGEKSAFRRQRFDGNLSWRIQGNVLTEQRFWNDNRHPAFNKPIHVPR